MHEGTLRALEFDRIVEAVRSFALTPLGASQLSKLRPIQEPHGVQEALAATSESVTFLEANPLLALQAPRDLEQILAILTTEGRPLDGQQLIGLADFLASIQAVRTAVSRATGGPFPILRNVLKDCRSFDREVTAIRAAIDPAGLVVDDATPELRAVRNRLRKQRNRLRSTLESYLRGKDTARYLQEQVITERGGRFVLVVRAEQRSAIPGIVHGSSGSGASLFLEPLSTVEINNDIVALEENETAEIRRVLMSLAGKIRQRALDLRHTLTGATEIDVIQACASFSRLIDGVAPELAADIRIELPKARHPLLIPAVRRRLDIRTEGSNVPHGDPVPVDLLLTPPTTSLVITGPNTGGKTVALKTIGLLALMAQAGLHVPAAKGSRVTAFRAVFADIGDEQSIAESLSTFSAHIANIVEMDRHLSLPALVLIDEIGAGTEPVEGGALAAAVIEHFKERQALVVATTHDDMLKSYASTTPGVSCAGFGFDPETFEPTYQVTYGSPGRSLALEIAERLGMAPTIIEAARQLRSARETQLANHLAKVDSDLKNLETERDRLAKEDDRLNQTREELVADRQRLQEKEGVVHERLQAGVDEQVRAARDEIDTVVQTLRQRVSDLEQAASARATTGKAGLSTGDSGALRVEARAAVEMVAMRAKATGNDERPPSAMGPSPPIAPVSPLSIGAQVLVQTLGIEGQVTALHDTEADVAVRGKRLRLPLTRLKFIGESASAPVAGGKVTVQVGSSSELLLDLNVIGCTVDEALARADKYLDRALVQEKRQLRVIHGHGTGRLRRAIESFLGEHPLVARFEPASPEHGGSGVTVIELKE